MTWHTESPTIYLCFSDQGTNDWYTVYLHGSMILHASHDRHLLTGPQDRNCYLLVHNHHTNSNTIPRHFPAYRKVLLNSEVFLPRDVFVNPNSRHTRHNDRLIRFPSNNWLLYLAKEPLPGCVTSFRKREESSAAHCLFYTVRVSAYHS